MEGGGHDHERGELLRPPIQESYGSSKRGPRSNNEDAIYSGSQGFGLAEIGSETNPQQKIQRFVNAVNNLNLSVSNSQGKPEKIFLRPEDVEMIHQEVVRLKNQGLLRGVDVVCDGMGGKSDGEMASSIATYFFVREIVKAVRQKNGGLESEDIRNAVFFAHQVIQLYNQKNNQKNETRAKTTLVAQVTGRDGRTFIVSVGDSRAYLLRGGDIERLTKDQTPFESLLSYNITSPTNVFTHELRNIIELSLGNQKLNPKDIIVTEHTFTPGDRLILCSDGVWKGIDPSDSITETKLQIINNSFRDNLSKRVEGEVAINIAYGEMFRLILKEKIDGTPQKLAEHLTRDEVGIRSQDNVSAVVVQINNPALSQEPHQSSPSPNEKKLSLTPGSLVAVKRSNGDIEYGWRIVTINPNNTVKVEKLISDGSGRRLVKLVKDVPLPELYKLNQLPEGVSRIDQARSFHQLYLILYQYYPQIQGSFRSYSAEELVELIQAVVQGREGININAITRTHGLREKVEELLKNLK